MLFLCFISDADEGETGEANSHSGGPGPHDSTVVCRDDSGVGKITLNIRSILRSIAADKNSDRCDACTTLYRRSKAQRPILLFHAAKLNVWVLRRGVGKEAFVSTPLLSPEPAGEGTGLCQYQGILISNVLFS